MLFVKYETVSGALCVASIPTSMSGGNAVIYSQATPGAEQQQQMSTYNPAEQQQQPQQLDQSSVSRSASDRLWRGIYMYVY